MAPVMAILLAGFVAPSGAFGVFAAAGQDVTFELFLDTHCPACADFAKYDLPKLWKDFGDEIFFDLVQVPSFPGESEDDLDENSNRPKEGLLQESGEALQEPPKLLSGSGFSALQAGGVESEPDANDDADVAYNEFATRKYIACVMQLERGHQSKYMPWYSCMEKYGMRSSKAKQCSADSGIEFAKVDACKFAEAHDLVHDLTVRTATVTELPTVAVNGNYITEPTYENARAEICRISATLRACSSK